MADNIYGGTSIQVYPEPGLTEMRYAHSDVAAFLGYVSRFNSINFHAKDDDVREWRFNKEYDNWQDRLGMDSVKVLYHFGHCGMGSDGTFEAGMGRTWDNTLRADSTRMSFGDHRLRYLMWHGCYSVQMHFGHNPWRTWAACNKGARMIFGFDGLTYDEPGLGKDFFREWNTGKSLSQSWQDAALATLRDHRPSSTACGATAEEAQDRLFNERFFFGDAVSDDWYWWRFGGPEPIEVKTDIPLPRAPKFLELVRRRGDERTAARLAERFDVRALVAASASPEPGQGNNSDTLTGPRLVFNRDGSYEVFLAEPDRRAGELEVDAVKELADEAVQLLNVDSELLFDGITATRHGGVGRDGDEIPEAVADYTAHYRQVHDGLPVVRGADGHVAVTVDGAKTLCTLTDRTVAVTGEAEAGPSGKVSEETVDRALAEAIDAIRRGLPSGDSKSSVEVVADSRDVGYRLDRDVAVTVAREIVEISSGGFAIRRIVEVTL